MYFALVIGVLNLMRWMMCAANCLVDARPRRSGFNDVRFHGAQQIR